PPAAARRRERAPLPRRAEPRARTAHPRADARAARTRSRATSSGSRLGREPDPLGEGLPTRAGEHLTDRVEPDRVDDLELAAKAPADRRELHEPALTRVATQVQHRVEGRSGLGCDGGAVQTGERP